MEQSQKHSLSEDEITALAEMKMPLVQPDYVNHFESALRSISTQNQLRGWEITLVSGLSVFLLINQPIPLVAGIPLYLIIVVFMLLEALKRVELAIILQVVLEAEKKLDETDIKKFRQHIATWEFGNRLWTKQLRRGRWHFIKVFWAPTLLLWHGGLALAVWLLLSGIM